MMVVIAYAMGCGLGNCGILHTVKIHMTSARAAKSHTEVIYILRWLFFPLTTDLGQRLLVNLWPCSTCCDQISRAQTHRRVRGWEAIGDMCQALIGLSVHLMATIDPLEMLFLFAPPTPPPLSETLIVLKTTSTFGADNVQLCSSWHSLTVLADTRRWALGGEITEQMAPPHASSRVAMEHQ